MANRFIQIWKTPDLRRKILFVLGILIVFRIAAHIPVPGIETSGLKQFFNSNQVLGLLNVFSGGALENFSIVMLGVGPYITASIIFQLLSYIIPRLQEIQKEGEQGQQRINRWTRLLAVPLAVMQAYATITLLSQSGGNLFGTQAAGTQNLISGLSVPTMVTAVISITAGSMFLMWLGELMSEKHVGNGISLIIFAGIVAQIPVGVQRYLATFDQSQVLPTLLFLGVALVTILAVVVITEGQRNIPVSYARKVRGNKVYGGVNTHLPLRVNQAGVIPIIFAVSLVVFPTLIAQFLLRLNISWMTTASQFVINALANQAIYGAVYFLMVVVFTYFYTYVVFHPDQIAENLQKQGGFIPGIRPGNPTAQFLSRITNRILLTGALFLGAIAVLPVILQSATGNSLVIGGTSLLIVVSVVIETVKQIDSQLVMREYEYY